MGLNVTRLVALVALSATALAACARRSALEPYPGAPIVLISVDTLRADHVGAYGATSAVTPHLDALARESVLFEATYAHVPLTLPAHASMFTGLLPPRHGVRDNVGFTLKDETKTLAARLKAAGYATGGAVSAYVLRRQTGIDQGFDYFEDALELDSPTENLGDLQRDGAVAVDALDRWIKEHAATPLLAFLHLYEPHSPYKPPDRYAHLTSRYDGEVAYADELVGRFLDRLKTHGLYDRAIVVVTADHGEGLNQHGEEEHGIFLYGESVHVPLIVRLPQGRLGGKRIGGPVAQVDIAATLLDLAGLRADGLDGVSLRRVMDGAKTPEKPVYAETLYPRYHFGWSELYSVTDGRYRFIRAPRRELYDLAVDRAETRNIAETKAAAVQAMDAWLARTVDTTKLAAPEAVPADQIEKLQALGYIGSTPSATLQGDLADPKDKIGVYQDLKRALALKAGGKDVEALAAFQSVVRDNPTLLDAWEHMGYLLIRMNRTKEGIAAVEKALKMDPGRMTAHLALARVFALGGDMKRATTHAELASAKNPGQGNEVLAQIMMERGDPARAAEFARKSLADDDRRIMSHFILGVVAQKAGRCEEALVSFGKAEDIKRLQKRAVVRNLHANAADCLARLGREAEAEKQFLAEIQEIPASESGRVGLAMLYRSQGRDGEARAVLADLIKSIPNPTADSYWTVVRTLSVLGDVEAARDWITRARARFPSDPRFRGA